MKLPDQVTVQARRDQEYERLSKQLDSATCTVFGVLATAKERSDLNLTLEALDRLIALIELRATLVGTCVVATQNGQSDTTAAEGGGGS